MTLLRPIFLTLAGMALLLTLPEVRGAEGDTRAAEVRPEFAVPYDKPQDRTEAAKILHQATVDLINLRRITKQVHWNVTGGNFYGVHQTTAELAELLEDHADVIAERAVALGLSIDARSVNVSQATRLGEGPVGFTPDFMMVRLMSEELAKMSELLRPAIDELGRIDSVGQDRLIDVKHTVDKYHWQFAVQVRDDAEADE